jgi:hypothetical protein
MPHREMPGTLRSRSRSRSRVHGPLEVKINLQTDADLKPRDDVHGALAEVEALTPPPAELSGLVPVDFDTDMDWVHSRALNNNNEGAPKSHPESGGHESAAVHPGASRDEGADAAAAAKDEEETKVTPEDEEETDSEDEEPHLTKWRTTVAENGGIARAYLSAVFKGCTGRHMVVEVSERQTSCYKYALFLLQEQAESMNYTKEQTVACRDRLLREGCWLPGVKSTSARPADDSSSDLD